MLHGARCEQLLRLNKRDIAYLRHIFEGYDGVATVTTIDRGRSIVKVTTVPDFSELVTTILEKLRREIGIEYLRKDDLCQ